MKKLISVALMITIILSIYGCTGTIDESSMPAEIDPPENPIVLIGSPFQSGDGDSIGQNCEITSGMNNVKDEIKEGTKIEIEVAGQKLEGTYQNTITHNTIKERAVYYRYNEENGDDFAVDAKTNKLISYINTKHLKNLNEAKENPIYDIDEAKEIFLDFIKETTGRSDWVEDVKATKIRGESIYYYAFDVYINGIRTLYAAGDIDTLGNIILFGTSGSSVLEDVTVPNWEDQVYIDGAKTRIEEFYKDKGVKEIKDYEVEDKRLRYLGNRESDAIEYVLNFTVVYEDGTEKETGNYFYYLF